MAIEGEGPIVVDQVIGRGGGLIRNRGPALRKPDMVVLRRVLAHINLVMTWTAPASRFPRIVQVPASRPLRHPISGLDPLGCHLLPCQVELGASEVERCKRARQAPEEVEQAESCQEVRHWADRKAPWMGARIGPAGQVLGKGRAHAPG